MPELTDCHIHTYRCGHATGSAEDCVQAALRRGLSGVVFAEHLPLPRSLDPDSRLSMPAEQIGDYLAEVDAARRAHPELAVVTGLEADFLPSQVPQTAQTLSALREAGVTVVLGSVHFLDGWAFDDPDCIGEWETKDIDEVWKRYFAVWCDAVSSGLFDIMAHPDLVKKFGHRPSFNPAELYAQAAAAAAAAGVRIEVSSAGLRKPVGELYPSAAFLRAFQAAGVPVVASSDAHTPDEVGNNAEAVYEAMRQAGYTSVSFPDGDGGWKEIGL
ncbi:MAG: histidinol-phosphatase HisJ family protein [Coriobacteriia bacterium]